MPYTPAARQKARWRIPPLWPILIAGYSTFGRSFAYLGVRPLFIGELYLIWQVAQNKGKWINRFIDGVLKLHLLPLSILLTVMWGLFEVARPVMAGDSVKDALRTCAFNYYPIYILIGIAIGRTLTLVDFVRFWKFYSGYYVIYAILLAALESSFIVAPWGGGDVLLFMSPALASLVPVGMLALWPLLSGWSLRWIVLPLSMVPMFFGSGRGTILGMGLGLLVVAASSFKRFVLVVGVMGVILVLMMIIGPSIKGGGGRAETFDPTINFARIIATVNEDFAYRMLRQRGYFEAAEEMIVAKGTSEWRKTIWKNAVAELNNTWKLALGLGHGASIGGLTPDGQEIHTPHNFVIYALYYTGAVGLTFFLFMLLAMLLASRRIAEPNIRAFQIAHVLMMSMVALVGNMFETPIAAIPFYLLSGVCIGLPLLNLPAGRRYA